jgi:hypothetical protein
MGVSPVVWDKALRLWRHRPGLAGHGIAPRERLLRLLRTTASERSELMPLPWSSGLHAALCAADASQGTLAMKSSWAIELQGASAATQLDLLVPLVERGVFPSLPRGHAGFALDSAAAVAACRRAAENLSSGRSDRAA